MKRVIYKSLNYADTEMLELDVAITYYRDFVEASSILDINDPAFFDFEADVLEACEIRDFELEDSYKSDYEESISQYYIFIKTTPDKKKLKVFLKIRISDHVVPDRERHGKMDTYKKRDEKYTKRTAKEFAKENFMQPRGYRARHIDIVFNDDNYTSYEKALQAIEARLDEFDPE